MPWYLQWSDSIKKRACRYLLQRYLGQFLEEKLTLDQLTVDIYNGTGSVSDVVLDVQALNELGEQVNLPIEFVDGYISEMSVSIPWASLFTESCFVEVTGMQLIVQPKQRSDDAGSMFETMWSSMTSSMQLATECLQQEVALADNKETENDQSMEGLELIAHAIESILTRVKIKFVNTIIRLEHLPKEGHNGIAVEVRVNKIDYCDEASSDVMMLGEEIQTHYQASAFAVKKFHCEGITFHTDEFPAEGRTFSRSVVVENKLNESLNNSDKVELHPILIGKLAGRLEIRLKLKQGESVHGPKVDLELNLGSLFMFLSPRQFHLLIELMQGLAAPHTQDTSNVNQRNRCVQKIMNPGDFEKVEQELQDTLHSPQHVSKSIPRHGWSSASVEESDDEFLPMKGIRGGLSESILSDASLDTSITSTNTSATYNSKSQDSATSGDYFSSPSHSDSLGKSKKKGRCSSNVLDGDLTGEVSGFHVRIASLAIVLLHEDILTLGIDTWKLTKSSVSSMRRYSETFFQQLGQFAVGGYGNKDFETAKQVFLKACDLNHIRLLATAVIIEGSESGNVYNKTFSSVLSAASLEILECLVENSSSKVEAQYVELLKFMKSSGSSSSESDFGTSNQPDLRIHFRQNRKNRHGRRNPSCVTEVTFTLQRCWSEIDLSIIDRVTAILNPQPLCHTQSISKDSMAQKSSFSQAVETASLPENNVNIQLKSPFVILKFRFPIPDLRPVHDSERCPWWQRSVRKDVLYIHFVDPTFQTDYDNRTLSQGYQLYASEITLLFQEGETEVAIPFAHATGDDKSENSPNDGQFFGLPHISLRICPKLVLEELEEMVDNEENVGLSQSFMDTSPRNPSPFNSKRIVHESDTSHRTEYEGEELIIPGDKQEMNEFINQASRDARVQVDIMFPYLSVHFPTKHLYEVIYNRINSDLSLWQSSAPKTSTECSNIPGVDVNLFGKSLFCFCKSGLQYESDSDTNEEDSSGIYYSAYEPKRKQGVGPQQLNQSKLALNININKGVLNVHTNLRDGSGNIVPEQHGEIQINLNDASLFSVTHFKGIPQHNYICLQVNTVSLYHKDVVGEINITRQLPLNWFGPPSSHLEPTIYQSDRGISVKSSCKAGSDLKPRKEMLTAAISTEVNENRVMTIRIACGLRGATLRHRVTEARHSWLTQLMDFFDVVDYPVRGYDSPQVITELHQHLWDCAVDYRPLNLPFQCVLTLGNLSVSSNMAARTKTSTLRFIAEDASLFMSDKISKRVPLDLRLDYISVIELGLFELSLRLSDQSSSPKVDLRASNNVLHIRTCSDSAHALAQLITYFASDGDLLKTEAKKTSRMNVEPLVQTTSENENSDINLTESTVERVNVMMEDAMKDVNGSDNKKHKKSEQNLESGVEVFFFPDEGNTTQLDAVTPVDWAGSDIDSDHDFCMLEHETGSGIMPQSGLPEVRLLTATPVLIVDNHFGVALGKADMLSPPKHYPTPVYRYTLRDMTLIWHMYGGQDFNLKLSTKKHVTIHESGSAPTSPAFKKHLSDTDIDEYGVSFSKINPKEVHISERCIAFKPDSKNRRQHEVKSKYEDINNWQVRGGTGRDHRILMQLQLNKVRFQHEVYPEKSIQASRQVLLVHELEIRDRLRTSHINKFLYQYSSEASPRQSHANMVLVKAVHLRPDPRRNSQETCLKVSLLPLRLNIDQDSLLFLINFVNQLSGVKGQGTEEQVNILSSQLHQAPVMCVDVEKDEDKSTVQQSTLLIMLDEENKPSKENNCQTSKIEKTPTSPIFVRSFIFSPEVPIRIDYEGKRVDMTHGPLAGLLMGLGQLSCLQLKLKRISHRHGLLGFDKLVTFVISEWLQDIKKNQLPSLIGGVGPMHSLVQLFQGIRDLFWLPIEQYQKDGRIVRGLQRGANSFTTSTAMAALELTARIVQAIQSVAETAFDMLSPGPSVRRLRGKKGKRQHRYSQPADIREGVANAYTLVKEGLGETAETLVRIASEEAEQKGAVGAVGGVLRQIPPTVVAPIILASAATSNLLGGVRSQLAPDVRREATLKWRTDDT